MANEIQIAQDSPNLLQRIASGVKSTWNGWFGPSEPIAPVAPPDTPARQLDYATSLNAQWMPRAGEKIGFSYLRMMADGCYLIRIIVDRVKDRVCTKSWHFRLKPIPGEYAAQTMERSKADQRIKALTDFYLFPDSNHTFREWLRMLLEDRLVIDAAALEVQRNRAGGILNLLPIDGSTINVLIDNTGRRPRAPLPAYRQIIKGLPAVDFVDGRPTESGHGQLIYMPANVRTHKLYGYSAVEQTLAIILVLLYKTVFHQGFYDESNIPLAYMQMPENTNVTEMMRLVREMEAEMNGDIKKRTKIYPVPFGAKLELIKKEEFQAKLEEWAARIFCFCLGETASPFVQQQNRATSEQSDETREESGEKPLMMWVKDQIDRQVQSPHIFNAPDIEFVWDEEQETDGLKQAQIDQINVSIRTRTPNELRQRDGLGPLDGGDEFQQPALAAGMNPPKGEDGEDDDQTPPPPGGKKATKAVAAQKKTLISYRY